MASEHIYKQYDADLQSIRAKVLEMGTIVEEQLSEAVQSLIEADTKLAEKVIRRDEEVNNLEIDIDEDCSLLIGKRSPVAADLRNVFDGIEGPLFYDHVHVSDRGNKIVAEKLFELTKPIVFSKIDTSL